MVGLSRTTLWRMVQAGTFPRPVVIGKRASVHVLEEVQAWMEARVQSGRPVATHDVVKTALARRPRG
jgi:predicted DNA-binding transcriptional regulator AlpA